MSTHDLYTEPVDTSTWDVPMIGDARFTWEYDDGRDRLLALYQKGKDKQWDAQKRIDWDRSRLNNPRVHQSLAIYGPSTGQALREGARELRRYPRPGSSPVHDGEQGAMVTAART